MEAVEQARRWANAKEKWQVETLYRLRIAVDYAAASMSHDRAEFGLEVVKEVFEMNARHTGRAL